MKVVITGGAGFLGTRLARHLLRARNAAGRGFPGAPDRSDRARRRRAAASLRGRRIVHVTGDIADPDLLARAIDADTASIFHLAAIVSGMAEADFELGLRINVDATRLLLDLCRRSGHRPRLVFTSSVAVYGGDLPPTVTDTTAVSPRSSYGTQKAVGELLISDWTRQRVRRRTRAEAADHQRASRPAERGGVLICQRDHPRAVERRRRRVSGRAGHAPLADVAAHRHRVPDRGSRALRPMRSARTGSSTCREFRSPPARWRPRSSASPDRTWPAGSDGNATIASNASSQAGPARGCLARALARIPAATRLSSAIIAAYMNDEAGGGPGGVRL